jgi:hypothetical protein
MVILTVHPWFTVNEELSLSLNACADWYNARQNSTQNC